MDFLYPEVRNYDASWDWTEPRISQAAGNFQPSLACSSSYFIAIFLSLRLLCIFIFGYRVHNIWFSLVRLFSINYFLKYLQSYTTCASVNIIILSTVYKYQLWKNNFFSFIRCLRLYARYITITSQILLQFLSRKALKLAGILGVAVTSGSQLVVNQEQRSLSLLTRSL